MVLLLVLLWAHDARADPNLGAFELKTDLERVLYESGRRQENARVTAERELGACLGRLELARTSTTPPPPSPSISPPEAPRAFSLELPWVIAIGVSAALAGLATGIALSR